MPPKFNLSDVLINLTVRKSIDLLVYLYTIFFVAFWIAQLIPGLTYQPFTFTSAENSGELYDYCSVAPLYQIDATIIDELYNKTQGLQSLNAEYCFNNPSQVSFCLAGNTENYGANPVNALKIQMLIMKSAGLELFPPFHLFSVPYTHYCIGVQHRSIAYDKDPPNVDYSPFWEFVKQNRATLYSGYNTDGYLRNIELLYYMPVWVYMACILVAEIYMLRQFYLYETDELHKDPKKIEPAFYYGIYGNFLPVILDMLALTFIVLKVTGICFVNNNDIFIIAALHMAAAIFRCMPIFIMRYKLSKPYSSNKQGTSLNIPNTKQAHFGLEKSLPPPRHRAMVMLYYFMLGMMVVIAGMWVSNELPSANVSLFNSHCDNNWSEPFNPQRLDACVAPDGSGYRSENAHFVLLGLLPPLVLLIWRLCGFFYFATQVSEGGTIKTFTPQFDSINAEVMAGVAVIGTWAIKMPKMPLTQKDSEGIELTYVSGNYTSGSLSNVRMLVAGRFIIPFATIVVGILLGILKLSQYSFWHGMPWWGISIIIVSGIVVSALTELGAIGYEILKNKSGDSVA